jgi:hypothetical protein
VFRCKCVLLLYRRAIKQVVLQMVCERVMYVYVYVVIVFEQVNLFDEKITNLSVWVCMRSSVCLATLMGKNTRRLTSAAATDDDVDGIDDDDSVAVPAVLHVV